MEDKKSFKRWYDYDPTVSEAVKLMENAPEDKQLKCAKFIIEKAQSYGVKITDNELSEVFSLFRRWYDKNKQVHDAFEYFKLAPYDVQTGIALNVIEILEDTKNN